MWCETSRSDRYWCSISRHLVNSRAISTWCRPSLSRKGLPKGKTRTSHRSCGMGKFIEAFRQRSGESCLVIIAHQTRPGKEKNRFFTAKSTRNVLRSLRVEVWHLWLGKYWEKKMRKKARKITNFCNFPRRSFPFLYFYFIRFLQSRLLKT